MNRGLAQSRERTRAPIMVGDVLVAEKPELKADADVNAEVRLRRPEHPFVDRRGVKLSGALAALAIEPAGLICADIGSSTGRATHCLQLAGAKHVYAVAVSFISP